MSRLLIIMSFTLTYFISYGQNPANNAIQSAIQKVNQGEIEEAIADLKSFLHENPNHFMALTALGVTYRQQKDFKTSVEMYKKALDVQPENITALYNLGVAHALADNKTLSFELLQKVKISNTFNITNIGLSPAAGILSADERYASLYPSSLEYSDPFVESNVEIVHDLHGENANDQYGWIARNMGDVNGDSVDDILSSAPSNNERATLAGKIYAHSGKTGELLWSYASEEANGQLGMSIESAGDVNRDGTPDVIAGAPYINKVYVFSGKDGTIISELNGNDKRGAFGRGVKGVGDVNKDGYGDLLIGEPFQIWGAPLNSDEIKSPGNVYLYSGKDTSRLQSWIGARIGDGFGTALAGKTTQGETILMIGSPNAGAINGGEVFIYKGMDSNPFFKMAEDSTSVNLGAMFMSVVGDINGDKIQDVYASDFGNIALGPATGRIYVHSGIDGAQLLNITGEFSGDGFGIGAADAGDIDNDGYDDLIVGSWQHASAAPSGGKVYLYSGRNGKLLRTITGKVVGETFGFDTTNIGDVNGDGVPDLLITSAWSSINGVRSGRTLVISGKTK